MNFILRPLYVFMFVTGISVTRPCDVTVTSWRPPLTITIAVPSDGSGHAGYINQVSSIAKETYRCYVVMGLKKKFKKETTKEKCYMIRIEPRKIIFG